MLNNKQIERLKANWGEKASSMACLAEVRVYDPLSPWACYIYAVNPENPDEICCLITGFTVEATEWTMTELASRYNAVGDPPIIDTEYRPIDTAELFKKLNKDL